MKLQKIAILLTSLIIGGLQNKAAVASAETKDSNIEYIANYSGDKITNFWNTTGYEYDFLDENCDFLYARAEPYYDSINDVKYLDNFTFIFNESDQYLYNFIVHLDFSKEEFNRLTTRDEKVLISFEDRQKGSITMVNVKADIADMLLISSFRRKNITLYQ